MEGFEPPKSCTQSTCSTTERHPETFDTLHQDVDPLALRVAARFAFRYEPKVTKERKVENLTKVIREATGLSKGMSESIADAVVRGREVERLALQKNWPIVDGVIEGPGGQLALTSLSTAG